MIRILWLTPNKPNNISVGRQRIVAHLGAKGFDVTIRAARFGSLSDLLIDSREYNVVIGTTRAGAIIGAGLTTVTGVPLVVDHVDPIRQFEETTTCLVAPVVRHLEHMAFRQSAHTLYVYPEEESRVRRFAPAATETDLGVDFERFTDPNDQILKTAKNRLNKLDLHDNIAIYVGGLEPIYHIEELVSSVNHLEDWSLVFLGSGSLEGTIKEAAANTRDVVFLGTVPHEEVPGYLHAVDVGISLVDDPHTLKVLEYGAARLPTVQLSGRAEGKLRTSVTYCDADPSSIADAVQQAAGSRVDELHELSKRYSWAAIARQYATIIDSVAANCPQQIR